MNGNNFYPLRLQLPDGRGDYYCTKPQIKLGRNPDCDLVFSTSRTLSRHHAEILFRGGMWYIRDTYSANGTYLNGQRLNSGVEYVLNPGDKIRLAGDVNLEVLLTPAGRNDAPQRPGDDWRNSTIGFEPIQLMDACIEPGPGPAVAASQGDFHRSSLTKCTACGSFYDTSTDLFCPICGFRQASAKEAEDSTVTLSQRKPSGMELVTCPNGHVYDKTISELCPICAGRKESAWRPAGFEPGIGHSIPVANAPSFPGSSRPESSRFCPSCGSRVSGMFCPRCGNRVGAPSDAKDSTVFLEEADSTACLGRDYPASMPVTPPRPSAPTAPPPAPSMASAPAAPAKSTAKKPGLFGRLFGGKQSAPAPAKPAAPQMPLQSAYAPPAPAAAPQTDDIQFRGAAPQNINPGEYFTVKIMMYREDDYQRADREAAAVADRVKAASSGVYQASRGQEFRIVLQSPDVDLEADSETLVWNGVFAAADFEVFLPDGYDRRQLRLRGRVYSGDAVLTDLKLILQVSAPVPQEVVCEKVRMQTAFISYASADRAKVVARLQGIMLARPDMDLFFDVESLRRGEAWEPRLYKEISQRDLFYLFWSHNAAASEWVRKELEYAVAQKTVDFIEPIPLEQPDVCPPPESLMCKHFNDWTLRYLNNQ